MTEENLPPIGYPNPMQTFLPYPDFSESAAHLDRKRLGKQRAETVQVLRALTVPGYGWRRHPDFYRPLFGDVPDDLPYVWPGSDRERRVPLDARA